MLSKIPINFDKIKKEDLEKEISGIGIIAELDAINLYEQLASLTGKENIRKVFLDITKEEKTHVGEFPLYSLMPKEIEIVEGNTGK